MQLLSQHKALRNASVSCLFSTSNQLYVHISIYWIYYTKGISWSLQVKEKYVNYNYSHDRLA